jgi:GT2 family glycosyltransferase
MENLPRVGIVVLNYNGSSCLPQCLQSLNRLAYTNKEVIVVDNNSADTSFDTARRDFPHFTFLHNTENGGFAKGMNEGMRLALSHGAHYCFLFNYDAEVDARALTKLVAVAEKHSRAGLLSPVVYNGDATVWFAKGKIDFLRMRAAHKHPSGEELASEAYLSDFLSGCALLIKKELVEKIGFLDERFFLYYEDADYSLRARQAGFLCLVVPGAKVWHREVSRENPEKIYHLVYSGLLFFRKHTPPLLRPYMAIYATLRRVKNTLDRMLRRKKGASETYRAYEKFYHEH